MLMLWEFLVHQVLKDPLVSRETEGGEVSVDREEVSG
jgi:hypothetical protein